MHRKKLIPVVGCKLDAQGTSNGINKTLDQTQSGGGEVVIAFACILSILVLFIRCSRRYNILRPNICFC